MDRFVLLLAQGCGLGRLKPAPGTWGSLGGIGWTLLLLLPGNVWVFVAGTLAGIGVSVWACGKAERILGERDPGSVVLDEIVALPVCYAAWILTCPISPTTLPTPWQLLTGQGLILTLGVFVAFRFFDILKPWPVRQSQAFPGGWGVTVDDLLAAGYVNLSFVLVTWFAPVW